MSRTVSGYWVVRASNDAAFAWKDHTLVQDGRTKDQSLRNFSQWRHEIRSEKNVGVV